MKTLNTLRIFVPKKIVSEAYSERKKRIVRQQKKIKADKVINLTFNNFQLLD